MIQIPFLKKSQLSTCTITRLVLSDNQDLISFVLDPNNDENLVTGFREIATGKFLVLQISFSLNLPRKINYSTVLIWFFQCRIQSLYIMLLTMTKKGLVLLNYEYS